MNKHFRNILILIFPFLMMVVINEGVRFSKYGKVFDLSKTNTKEHLKEDCSWACHNNTRHCLNNHVRMSESSRKKLDGMYFGAIRLLKETGNYRLANIVVFVVLFPLAMYVLLIKVIALELQIRKLKKYE